jgi:hypothetical protein
MKKDAADKAQRKGRKPFFARLLEAQELKQASGGFPMTRKCPSDSDTVVTMKYPSDSDEIATTLKYPSDSDEI